MQVPSQTSHPITAHSVPSCELALLSHRLEYEGKHSPDSRSSEGEVSRHRQRCWGHTLHECCHLHLPGKAQHLLRVIGDNAWHLGIFVFFAAPALVTTSVAMGQMSNPLHTAAALHCPTSCFLFRELNG